MMPAMKSFKELIQKKVATPEETAAIVSASAIARGVDKAKAQIIGILGRERGFIRVHVGITDVDLGIVAKKRGGYTVTLISITGSPQVIAGVGKAVGVWLHACHGKRYETQPEKPVVKPGTKRLYLGVAYPAGQVADKAAAKAKPVPT